MYNIIVYILVVVRGSDVYIKNQSIRAIVAVSDISSIGSSSSIVGSSLSWLTFLP